ncbi:fructose-1,6-bisphosphatase/inositol monophosphatase family enzyme [Arthrobacter sp. B1I2]|nr:fructose-1,6-bisphosphatase/inositol monophosphatase family enzyme [Arthrobacter sp. B1I2]
MTSVSELLEVARQAAAAGAKVLSGRDGNALDASNKGAAGDWVTAFDVAAENAVRDVIAAARPGDSITGEEQGTTRPADPTGYR